MARKVSAEDKREALAQLRKWMPPGARVFTILRHRSSSGMYRVLDVYVIDRKDGRPLRLTWSAAAVLGWRYDERHEGIGVNGCGLDVGFHLVNSLSYALHGMTSKGEGAAPENQGRPYEPRRGNYRAGYSLKHEWL